MQISDGINFAMQTTPDCKTIEHEFDPELNT